MAAKGYAVLDIQNDDDELQFQDFGLGNSGTSSQTHTFTDFPDSPEHQTDTDKLLGEYQDDEETPEKKNLSFWSFEFYQQFFDVDSKKVGDRIIWSMIPKPGMNFLQLHLRPKPDLYGPFWICLTLVFAAAITGNISNYLQTQDESVAWRYDFHKVSLAAFMVFSYGWLVPLILWSVLRYRSKSPALNLLEFVCLYGYSLSVLVPVCIVWTVPMVWLRWCVGIVGVVLSGAVLAKSVWEGLKGRDNEVLEENETESSQHSMKKIAMIIVLLVVIMHIAIAMGFMFYFFREPLHSHGIRGGAPVAVETVNNSSINNLSPAGEAKSQALKDPIISPTKRDVEIRTDQDISKSAALKKSDNAIGESVSKIVEKSNESVEENKSNDDKSSKVSSDVKQTDNSDSKNDNVEIVKNETSNVDAKEKTDVKDVQFKIIVPPKSAQPS